MKKQVTYLLPLVLLSLILVACAGKSTDVPGVCGNGIVEKGEDCEPPGVGACNSECKRDVSMCGDGFCHVPENSDNCPQDCPVGVCGNNSRDEGEDCDGPDLGGIGCEMLGFPGGTLRCSLATCEFDVSECINPNCGNSYLDEGEECDSANLNGQSCENLGYDGGTLKCDRTCRFDDSACYQLSCGNGVRDEGEECEGWDLNNATCSDFGFAGGVLKCSESCRYDKSDCIASLCGNLIINDGEQCDGPNLDNQTCITRGYYAGVLACHGNCTFNESGCTNCGNGVVNTGEACDGNDLGGQSCVTLGYDGGTLGCNANCTFNENLCYQASCGDGVLDPGEQCDSGNLNDATCVTLGYTGGTLSCNTNCTYNTSNCTTSVENCGNGTVEGGEQCDGTNLDGKTCQLLGFSWGGTLSCNSSCQFNTSQCHSSCWPDRFEPNNGSSSATTVAIGTRYDDLTICVGDADWFKFTRASGVNYRIQVFFTHANGNLDLEIYRTDYKGGAYSNDDNETFDMPASFDGGTTGTYHFRVYGRGHPNNDANINRYSVQVTTY